MLASCRRGPRSSRRFLRSPSCVAVFVSPPDPICARRCVGESRARVSVDSCARRPVHHPPSPLHPPRLTPLAPPGSRNMPSKREPNVISCFVSTKRYGLSAGAAVLLSKTRASTPQESASRTDWRRLRRCFASPVPLLREGSPRCEMHDVYKMMISSRRCTALWRSALRSQRARDPPGILLRASRRCRVSSATRVS